VDKGGRSSVGKIVLAELFPLVAKYTQPFNKSEKSNYSYNFWYG